MAILYFIFRSLFGQKPPAQKSKIQTTAYRSILISANGRFYGLLEVL